MSGTKSSIGFGGRGEKALCGRATSWGQSSAEGTPTTLWNDNSHQSLFYRQCLTFTSFPVQMYVKITLHYKANDAKAP